MTAARLTPAEARRLGIDVPTKPARTTRRTARGPYRTRCKTCGAEFTSEAAEDRHIVEQHHARYEVVL